MDAAVLDPILPTVHDRVAQRLVEQGLPGASVGIVCDQELAWTAGFGYADVASERRPDEHTLFRVASITKTFTATAIVRLRDEDRLHLDDPLVRHVPEFAAVRNRFGPIEDVTLRRLLAHRSGLVGEPPLGQWERLEFPGVDEILAALPRVFVAIEPDSAFKYSNLALALLGVVVERVSGHRYVDYVRAEILEPLGMSSTCFELTDALRPRLATGYLAHPFQDEPAPAPHPLLNGEAAADQLYSSVHDLARWLALQFRARTAAGAWTSANGTGQVLGGKSIEEMHRPQYLEADWSSGHAVSWFLSRRGDNVHLGHGGSLPGFRSQILFNKQHRVGAIVLANGIGAPLDIAIEILETLIGEARPAQGAAAFRKPTPTPPEWQRFLGRYVDALGADNLMRVECRGGSLFLATPPMSTAPVRLDPTDEPHVFLVAEGRYAGEALTFRLDDDGIVTGFVAAGFAHRKLLQAGHPVAASRL